jgi:hypothetical protein
MIRIAARLPNGVVGVFHITDAPGVDIQASEMISGACSSTKPDEGILWLEAEGSSLDIIQMSLCNIPYPRSHIGGSTLNSMRWFGDTARMILWAWLKMQEPPSK